MDQYSSKWRRLFQSRMPTRSPGSTPRARSALALRQTRVAIGIGVAIPAAIGCAVDDLLVPQGARSVPDQRCVFSWRSLPVVDGGSRGQFGGLDGVGHVLVS